MRKGNLFRTTRSYNKFKKKRDKVDAQADALLRYAELNLDAYRPADLRKEAGKLLREYDALLKEIPRVLAEVRKRDLEEAKAAERDAADLSRTIEEARTDFEADADEMKEAWGRVRDKWVELQKKREL